MLVESECACVFCTLYLTTYGYPYSSFRAVRGGWRDAIASLELEQRRVVAFLFRTRMFIFTKRFPVTPTRNHDHPQLGGMTLTDGRVKGVS